MQSLAAVIFSARFYATGGTALLRWNPTGIPLLMTAEEIMGDLWQTPRRFTCRARWRSLHPCSRGPIIAGTSNTSNTLISTGLVSFEMNEPSLDFNAGIRLRASVNGGSNQWMEGVVQSWVGTC